MSEVSKNRSDYLRVIEELKKAVKAKGYTYAMLSRKLKLSEPTVKRIFQGTPCNTDKLIRICDILGVSLLDIVQLASKKGPEKYYLTPEQENWFAKHPDHYAFFYAIYYETEGPLEALSKKWGISKNESFKYLRKLEEFGLLEVLPENKYLFKVSGQLNVDERGVLMRSWWVRDEMLRVAKQIADKQKEPQHFFQFGGCQMSQATFDRFIREVEQVALRYYDDAAREEQLTPSSEKSMYAACFAMGPYELEVKRFWDVGRKIKEEHKK